MFCLFLFYLLSSGAKHSKLIFLKRSTTYIDLLRVKKTSKTEFLTLCIISEKMQEMIKNQIVRTQNATENKNSSKKVFHIFLISFPFLLLFRFLIDTKPDDRLLITELGFLISQRKINRVHTNSLRCYFSFLFLHFLINQTPHFVQNYLSWKVITSQKNKIIMKLLLLIS